MSLPKIKDLAIIGLGLRGLILASKIPKKTISDSRVAIFEARNRLGGGILFDYDTETNSKSGKFYSDISISNGIFSRGMAKFIEQKSLGVNPENTQSISTNLEKIASELCVKLKLNNCLFECAVSKLEYLSEKAIWRIHSPLGIVESYSVLLSTGRVEKETIPFRNLSNPLKINDFIGNSYNPDIEKILKLRILGASHSAFSVATYFLKRFPERNVTLFSRNFPIPYFESQSEIPSWLSYDAGRWETCKFSGAINRDTGIRSPSKELLFEAMGGSHRITIDISSDPVPRFIAQNKVANVAQVQATGFEPICPLFQIQEQQYGIDELQMDRHRITKIGIHSVKGLSQIRLFPTPKSMRNKYTQEMRNYDDIVEEALQRAITYRNNSKDNREHR